MSAPEVLFLNADAVGRINWQPRYCPPPMPCLASRRVHDGVEILEIVFNPSNDALSHRISGTRHRYRLEPWREGIVRAVNIDAEIWGPPCPV